MLKFRRAVIDAARKGPAITHKGNTRVTKVGRFLREVKLDELPGVVNVLRGEVNLIGLEARGPVRVERYTPQQLMKRTVTPGITRPTQVRYGEENLLSGANPETECPRIMSGKLNIDLDYDNNRTFGLDTHIVNDTAMTSSQHSGDPIRLRGHS